jgi:hypothetical protein
MLVCIHEYDFRIVVENSHRSRVDMQTAEAPAEGFVLGWSKILVAKEDDQMFEESISECVEVGVTKRASEIDACNFGADRGCQRMK